MSFLFPNIYRLRLVEWDFTSVFLSVRCFIDTMEAGQGIPRVNSSPRSKIVSEYDQEVLPLLNSPGSTRPV